MFTNYFWSNSNLSNCLTTFRQTPKDSFSSVSKPILQEYTRWKALTEIYQLYIPLHISDKKSAEFQHECLRFNHFFTILIFFENSN